MKITDRTTIGEYFSRTSQAVVSGIYVISCYPALGCLYIGVARDIGARIRQHIADNDNIGAYIKATMPDSCGFRLDIFDIKDSETRLFYERKLIKRFSPVYNVANNTDVHSYAFDNDPYQNHNTICPTNV